MSRTKSAGKFHGVRPWNNGCLYVAMLENGMVKVGRTMRPANRLQTLDTTCNAKFGSRLKQWHVGPDLPCGACHELAGIEASLISSMAAIGVPVDGAREFFTGVLMDAAIQLVEDASTHYASVRAPAERQAA